MMSNVEDDPGGLRGDVLPPPAAAATCTQNNGGAIGNPQGFFRVMPERNHLWFHREPFKPGFFKEPVL